MSHSSKIFDNQPIRVQNVNGFDLSHLVSGTAYTGTLTPVLSRMLMPRTKFSLGCAVEVHLPPLAAPAFGRVDVHIECFWVNCSILYGGWKQFISNNPETSFLATQASGIKYDLPVFEFPNNAGSPLSHVNTLYAQNLGVLDYLGMAMRGSSPYQTWPGLYFNLMPLLAYHRIWDVFYRNPQVTRTIFGVNPDTSDTGFTHNVAFINHSYLRNATGTGVSTSNVFNQLTELTFPDGISVFQLRQRNYSNDYYTAGSLKPQQGNPSALNFTVDLNTGDGEFTLAALRAVNSLQKFMEANNYDNTYRGIIRANFGVSPGDADQDEPIYLGRLVVPVYQKGINVQSGSYAQSLDFRNPFIGSEVWNDIDAYCSNGAQSAQAKFIGNGEICRNFRVSSFGYVMGIFSLVPHANYNYGIDRHFRQISIGDYPFPLLQSVGMDSVKNYEVYATSANVQANTDFSYIPRYSFWKYVCDRTAGELAPGRTLAAFQIQRSFSSAPSFSTSFLEIQRSDLDQLFPVTSENMKFSCWYEVYWVFKAVMPLAEFCVPTLGEMQDTHEIRVKQGGSRL